MLGFPRRPLAAAALLASLTTGGCGYGGATKSCDIRFPPQEAPSVEGGRIRGRVYAICDERPEVHHLEYWLAKRNTNGAFAPASDRRTSDRIPGTRRTDYDAVTVTCERGVWRVEARATGALKGTPFDFSTFSGNLAVAAADC
ncbi:hypothetical protein HCN51_55060 [Nonomuraea sp. FMUSA5-5]|uniref:Lipoprotein n=1 Tax=Nonomuraea composti TaxID=2720023 RepID=A0ABX1BT14_9ACTN|nr:hypothetical protein [Nonomuraea sp. FMUSA5-5]NJP98451.1 hypothetical protein [Nonomuraea sp. FMUSA5-5]